MYLKVQYNNSIKLYTLTDNYNKPYIKISNSILPLTTNTTQGLHIKLYANNTTYIPLEYNSMSTSDTYYTSAIQSNGLSSTTALTRSSTYDTQYYTRSSTSSTVYYTRSSTSATNYLTKSGISCTSFRLHWTQSGQGYQNSPVTNVQNMSAQITGSTSITKGSFYIYNGASLTATCTVYTVTFSHYSYSSEHTGYPGNGTTYSTTNREYGQVLTFAITTFRDDNVYQANSYHSYSAIMNTSGSYGTWHNIRAGNGVYTNSQLYSIEKVISVSTTGTQYLTRSSTSATSYLTRSSTYSTIYLTRSSTSGYSGVSSSSSQSSGWL